MLPELWPHQRKVLEETNHLPKLVYLHSPRLGKSRVTIEWLQCVLRHLESPTVRVLVTAPLVVCPQWITMLEASGIAAVAAYGMPTTRVAAQLKLETCRVVVMNDDKLAVLEESILKWSPLVYIGDESHRFRGVSTARGKSMRKVAWRAKYVRLLTGTPTVNNVGNLWGQFVAIDKELWGKSFSRFASRYLIRDSMFPSKVLGVLHADELRRMVESCASIVSRNEVFGQDQWQVVVRNVELPTKARKLYQDLVKEWVVENALEKQETIDVTHTLKRMTRLQQLTSGFIVDEQGNQHKVHSAKTDLVMNDLEEIIESGEKVVVFHKFTAEGKELYERSVKQFGLGRVFRIAGDVSGKQRETSISLFNSSKEAGVFIVQTQAGGIGISLASALHVFFVSQSFSYDVEEQARDRVYSPGCGRCVTFYRTANSIDGYVAGVLEQKQNLQDAIMSGKIEDIANGNYTPSENKRDW
jgi:SNF2 family DNA or RNA helicase